MSINVAIDGPAGAGKSTIAKKLAKELDYIYVDTGAMYRAMALYMIEQKTDIQHMDAVRSACDAITIDIRYSDGEQQVILNGRNVNDFIRTEAVSEMSSKISAIPEVRAKLLSLQRSLAAASNVIMDGRDIGTRFTEADVKIFLTADAHVRALRRYEEFTAKGINCTLENVEREVIERDERDMNRAIAPLKQAEDAVRVDTSQMNIDEVVNCLRQLILDRI
ncbi:MAG: (d)CMP kinase [Coprococcus sp.]